jgi:hypothetical protein
MKFNKKAILELALEKHSYKTLSLTYAILTKELMEKTKVKKPSKRSLRKVSNILTQMKELGDCVAYHPKYFDKQGNALVTLLRHGAKYLEKNRFYERDDSSSNIGELFAFRLVIEDPRMPRPRGDVKMMLSA